MAATTQPPGAALHYGKGEGGGKKGKKPNFEKFETAIREQAEALEKLDQQFKSCEEEIKAHEGDWGKYQGTRDEQRKHIADIQAKIDEQQKAKDGIQQAIDEHVKKGREIKNKIQDMKRSKKVVYTSEEAIDSSIKEIEQYLMTSTLSTKEEKEYIQKISDLKKSRPHVSQLKSLSEASTDSSSIEPLKLQRNEAVEKLNKLKELRKAEYDKEREMQKNWEQSNAPVKALIEQKSQLWQQLKDHRSKRSELQRDLMAEKKKFQEKEREDRRLRNEKIQEERAKRQKQQAIDKLKAELDDNAEPYSQSLVDARAALQYLKRQQHNLSPVDLDGTSEDKSVKAEPVVFSVPVADGEELVMPKKYRVEEVYLPAKGGKNKKAKAKKQGEQPKKAKPLAHEMRAVADFTRMGFPLPISLEEIPASIRAIEEKMKGLEDQHSKDFEKWQASKEAKERKLAALESGMSWDEIAQLDAPKKTEEEIPEPDALKQTADESPRPDTVKRADESGDGLDLQREPDATETPGGEELHTAELEMQKAETGSTKSETEVSCSRDVKEVSPEDNLEADIAVDGETKRESTHTEGSCEDEAAKPSLDAGEDANGEEGFRTVGPCGEETAKPSHDLGDAVLEAEDTKKDDEGECSDREGREREPGSVNMSVNLVGSD